MDIINLQIEIFVLLLVGYFLSYKKKISETTRKQLTNMSLDIILPAAIINSFQIDLTPSQLQQTWIVLACSIGIQFLYMLFNKFLWQKEEENKKICLQYATLVSNAGFMGMPIAQGVFGDIGLLYASIFLIPQRIVMWSAGLSLFVRDNKTNIFKKVALHPCIIALEIGIIVMILRCFHIYLPKSIDMSLRAIGNCNTAICMIVIGALLQQADKNDVFNTTTLLYSLVRLVVLPSVIWIILYSLNVPPLALHVCVLESAMPAASTTAMLAGQYDRNPYFAGKLIFVSTLLSLFTIPVFSILFQIV